MKNILITGCNRGLGLGLVKQFLKEPNQPENILATCRDVEKAKELSDISKAHHNVHIVRLDVTNTATFDDFAKQVVEIVGENGLNLLFNNAGYSPKSTRINFVTAQQIEDTFAVNVTAPILLTKALLPILKKAACSNDNGSLAAVVNMSSILGSISANTDGGLYPYRCSKAALNMATKSMSVDFQKDGILATCLHPGWVQTDMGGKNAPMTIDQSVRSIVKFIQSLSKEHNGGFYQWDGKKLDW